MNPQVINPIADVIAKILCVHFLFAMILDKKNNIPCIKRIQIIPTDTIPNVKYV